MIPSETHYKVLIYIDQISTEQYMPLKFEKTSIIMYLLDRGHIRIPKTSPKKVYKTSTFISFYNREILQIYLKLKLFIEEEQIEYLEKFYTIYEIEQIIKIKNDCFKITNEENTFQSILSEYFGSSKYTRLGSKLSNAIKQVLNIELFPEEKKDLQYLSILYPKNKTKYIILCENLNRLIFPRHSFIEFWYAGGKNTKQLRYAPTPNCPIFYLCDWDFDGLGTYVSIKQKYLCNIKLFVPINFMKLKIKQELVKKHRSLWKNKKYFHELTQEELSIAEVLYNLKYIVEEQKIKIDDENLSHNGIL